MYGKQTYKQIPKNVLIFFPIFVSEFIYFFAEKRTFKQTTGTQYTLTTGSGNNLTTSAEKYTPLIKQTIGTENNLG